MTGIGSSLTIRGMERFNTRGMLIIPNQLKRDLVEAEKLIVIGHLYCPAGHELISKRAVFNGYPGVLLKICGAECTGLVALSPIFGQKARITVDADIKSGEIVKFCCPHCGVALPAYAPCTCGAELIALFTTPEKTYSDCVGVCNRVDCVNAQMIVGDELVSLSMLEAF